MRDASIASIISHLAKVCSRAAHHELVRPRPRLRRLSRHGASAFRSTLCGQTMQTVWANVHVHVERVCASASPGHRPGCHFRPGPTANDVERQALGAVFRKFLLPTQQGRLSQVPCSGVNFFLFFFSDNSDYHFWEAASAEEGGSCISRRVAYENRNLSYPSP